MDGSIAMAESFSGRELGRRIVAGLRSYVAGAMADVHGRHVAVQKAVENTTTLEVVRGEIDAAWSRAALPSASPGLTLEDVRPMLEGKVAEWALDFERRAQAMLERAVDRIPRPRDGIDGAHGLNGIDGKDGKDGVDGAPGEPGGSIDDFDIGLDGRELTVSMKIGERIERRTIKLDMPMYRDVYKAGEKYERGDMVTFSGSVFVATRDTTGSEKPEASPAWKLMVKRGRDGKDAEQ